MNHQISIHSIHHYPRLAFFIPSDFEQDVNGWFVFGPSRYLVVTNNSLTRDDAILECQYLGGRLAELHTPEKLSDLRSLLAKMVKNGTINHRKKFHIGYIILVFPKIEKLIGKKISLVQIIELHTYLLLEIIWEIFEIKHRFAACNLALDEKS